MQNQGKLKVVHYTATAKWLHWLMAGIWITSWLIAVLAVYWRDELNPEHGLTILHKALASSLLFLIVIRLVWRFIKTPPALPSSMSPLMQRGAKFGHLLLYGVALIGLPLSGWYWSSVADHPVIVLYLFELPPLVAANEALYDLGKNIHFTLAWFSGALVAGHGLVALKHHFIDKDTVLLSMWPKRFTKNVNQ